MILTVEAIINNIDLVGPAGKLEIEKERVGINLNAKNRSYIMELKEELGNFSRGKNTINDSRNEC